jgi:hypothetical protein
MAELPGSRRSRKCSYDQGENAIGSNQLVLTHGNLALGLIIFLGLGFMLGVLFEALTHLF